MAKYCIYCGNTGELPNGGICTHCKTHIEQEEDLDLSCLEIPISYRGAVFSGGLLPRDMGNIYASYMESLYKEVTSLKPMCKNIFVSSPAQTGKTVFVYSCMSFLFKKRIPIFPYFDVNELECIMRDLDKGKKCKYVNEDVDAFNLYESEILFTKIPEKLEYSTAETLATLIDRRVRRSRSTIIMSTKSWSDVLTMDKANVLKELAGDGSFKSILVKNFWRSN